MKRALKTTSLPAGLIALTLFAALLAPSAALASWEDLLQQACGTKGQVTGTFTQAEYKQALANIPADADQYSNCRLIIEQAQLAAATGSNALTEAQAAAILATATPEEQAAIAKNIAAALEKENAGYDVDGYRDAPPGLRIWCGATVDTADIQALGPWLDWAYAQANA